MKDKLYILSSCTDVTDINQNPCTKCRGFSFNSLGAFSSPEAALSYIHSSYENPVNKKGNLLQWEQYTSGDNTQLLTERMDREINIYFILTESVIDQPIYNS